MNEFVGLKMHLATCMRLNVLARGALANGYGECLNLFLPAGVGVEDTRRGCDEDDGIG
jgi:hypothetical protein